MRNKLSHTYIGKYGTAWHTFDFPVHQSSVVVFCLLLLPITWSFARYSLISHTLVPSTSCCHVLWWILLVRCCQSRNLNLLRWRGPPYKHATLSVTHTRARAHTHTRVRVCVAIAPTTEVVDKTYRTYSHIGRWQRSRATVLVIIGIMIDVYWYLQSRIPLPCQQLCRGSRAVK